MTEQVSIFSTWQGRRRIRKESGSQYSVTERRKLPPLASVSAPPKSFLPPSTRVVPPLPTTSPKTSLSPTDGVSVWIHIDSQARPSLELHHSSSIMMEEALPTSVVGHKNATSQPFVIRTPLCTSTSWWNCSRRTGLIDSYITVLPLILPPLVKKLSDMSEA